MLCFGLWVPFDGLGVYSAKAFGEVFGILPPDPKYDLGYSSNPPFGESSRSGKGCLS